MEDFEILRSYPLTVIPHPRKKQDQGNKNFIFVPLIHPGVDQVGFKDSREKIPYQ